MVANIGLSVERDEFVTWLEEQICEIHEWLCRQSLQMVQGTIRDTWHRLKNTHDVKISTFLLQVPMHFGLLLSTPPTEWIDFVNLRFQAPDNSTLSLVNCGHAFVNCINPLAAVLLATEEVGLVGKQICPRTSKSIKTCQVWHAGYQGLEKNVQYLKEDVQGRKSQIGLPDQCRAVYKLGGHWQIVCPEQKGELALTDTMTTVMIRGIPPRFCTRSIKQMINNAGSHGKYNGRYPYRAKL